LYVVSFRYIALILMSDFDVCNKNFVRITCLQIERTKMTNVTSLQATDFIGDLLFSSGKIAPVV